MNKTKILWKIIQKNNIKYVFGIPGSPIVPILAYKPLNINWLNVGNELDNGYIAQSYGFFSNTIGILIVTGGPGIGTTISSIANAFYEKNPLVVISIFEKTEHGFQNWDIVNISKSIIPYTVIITSRDDFEEKISYAFYIAKTLNTGVIILIDSQILLETSSYKNLNLNLRFEKLLHFDEPSKIVAKLNRDLDNKETILIIGHIPHLNFNILKTFLDNNNIPFVLTWKQRTLLNYKNFCGFIGSLGYHSANYAVHKSKYILIVGDISSNLNDSSYNNEFSLDSHIKKDIIYSVVIEKSRAIDQSTKVFLTNNFNYLFTHLKINVHEDFYLKLKNSNSILRQPLTPKSELEKYCYLSSIIYTNKNLNIPVVTGVGNHWYSMGKYFYSHSPNNWLTSTEWASIGSGYFYGIGAFLSKQKPVWIFEGDGGTIFAGTTLLYLINNKHLPLTIIIFKDSHYSAIVSSFHLQNLDSKPHKKNQEIICKTPNLNVDMLPNCHHFYNLNEYYNYLNRYPTSTKLRFIVVHIKNTELDNNYGSYIYTVDIHDKKYLSLIKQDKLEELKNYETKIKTSSHN